MAKITIEFDMSESDKVIPTLRKVQRLFSGTTRLASTRRMVEEAPEKVSLPRGAWSMKHDRCIVHGGTDIKHAGKGMCQNCYAKHKGIPPKITETPPPVPSTTQIHAPVLNIVWTEGMCSNTECPYPTSDYMGMPVVMGRSGQYYCCEECRLVSADSPI